MKRCLSLIPVCGLAASALAAASLYDQSIARLLAERYRSPDVSYLLIDGQTHRRIAFRWDDLQQRVPVGSLLKPFVALAYGQKHNFQYPTYTCHGTADGCWLPGGHGRIPLSVAISFSCNAYFLNLASQLSAGDMDLIAQRYGLSTEEALLDPAEMIGLGRAWRVAPEDLVNAYLLLAATPHASGVAQLLGGMALSAAFGTAGAVDRPLRGSTALAKTGTAPCVHEHRAPGDGYVLMLYPADQPRLALLIRMHGVPGAQAAAVGGRMLNTVLMGQ